MTTTRTYTKKPLVLAIGAAIAATSPMAAAQSPNANALEEIVVTATRRETSVQDVTSGTDHSPPGSGQEAS